MMQSVHYIAGQIGERYTAQSVQNAQYCDCGSDFSGHVLLLVATVTTLPIRAATVRGRPAIWDRCDDGLVSKFPSFGGVSA